MERIQVRRLAFMIALMVVLAASDHLRASCGNCLPQSQGGRNGPISYRFDGITGAGQNIFRDAAADWNGALGQTNVSLVYSDSGTVQISLDFAVCPNWGEARYGQFNYMKICPDALSESNAFMERLIRHEFGHILGLGTSDCSKADTVMTSVQPADMNGATSVVGCADTNYANQYLRTKRDDDADGYSPEDFFISEQDCDDTNSLVHPNAFVDCDSLIVSPDRDCDGVLDSAECGSPVILDLGGNGIRLTGLNGGVLFDLNADDIPEPLPWTEAGSDDAWLVFDRDGDGRIADGTELFGSFSPQTPSSEPNGYRALAMFDEPAAGGNGDGAINNADRVFSQLRLWQDRDHDGKSSPSELLTLVDAGVSRLDLDYQETWRKDSFGNLFRFKARVDSQQPSAVARWSYDVFLWATDQPGHRPHPFAGHKHVGGSR